MDFTYQDREYQTRLVSSTVGAFINDDEKLGRTLSSVLILSPCGSGKTVTAMRIIEDLYHQGYRKVVFIAHRHKLLNQAISYLKTMGLSERLPELDFRAVSIYEKDTYSLRNADLVIFDEAHHSACDSGVRLVNRIKPRKYIGLTATNWRSDRIKLIFERVITDYGINSLIEQGFLSKYDHYSIDMWTPESVVETYLSDVEKFGKSIMYFHTTEESESAVQMLKDAGVAAESIYGTHSEASREAIYDRFESGETKVLCNLILLTEGADFPDLQSVFVKPSIKGLTIQMGGRALRLAKGKTHANIVQMAGGGYSFTRVANCQQSFVRRNGNWIRTKLSKEFLQNIGKSTFEYKLSLARDESAFAKLDLGEIQKKNAVNMDFLTARRDNPVSLEDLEQISMEV